MKKGMRKIINILLSVVLAIGIIPPITYADNAQITVMIDNQKIWFDQPPIIIDDRTLVPLRAIFEALGAEVTWFDKTQTVTAKRKNTVIKIDINDTKLYVNDTFVDLDVPAKIVNERTLVPVRAISEAFGCKVDWDDKNSVIYIKSKTNNNETTEQKYEYNMYSTLFDLSGINWYLTQNYGFDEPSNCFFFEDEDPEESMIFAQRLNASEETEEVVIFHFNCDIEDWYEFNSDVIVPYKKEIVGNAKNGDVIKRFDYKSSYTGNMALYCQFDKTTGCITKTYSDGGLYGYHGCGIIIEIENGKVVSTYHFEGKDYYDVFFKDAELNVFDETRYFYNADGTLNSCLKSYYSFGESSVYEYDEITYLNSHRKSIHCTRSWDESESNGTLEYQRDANGNVECALFKSDINSHPNKTSFVKYNPGGIVKYECKYEY